MSTYQIDRAKWQKMSIFEQMGNIGSEVGRTFICLRRNDNLAAEAAMIRALDLFDITGQFLAAKKPAEAREVLRAKEEYLQAYVSHKPDESLEKYFNNFAIAARLLK